MPHCFKNKQIGSYSKICSVGHFIPQISIHNAVMAYFNNSYQQSATNFLCKQLKFVLEEFSACFHETSTKTDGRTDRQATTNRQPGIQRRHKNAIFKLFWAFKLALSLIYGNDAK